MKDQTPCALGLYCAVCEQELLSAVEGNVKATVMMLQCYWTFGSTFQGGIFLFRCVALWWVCTGAPSPSEQWHIFAWYSDNTLVHLHTTSVISTQVHSSAGGPTHCISACPEEYLATLQWQQFNWWVKRLRDILPQQVLQEESYREILILFVRMKEAFVWVVNVCGTCVKWCTLNGS